MKKVLFSMLTTVVALGFVACSGDNNGNNTRPIESATFGLAQGTNYAIPQSSSVPLEVQQFVSQLESSLKEEFSWARSTFLGSVSYEGRDIIFKIVIEEDSFIDGMTLLDVIDERVPSRSLFVEFQKKEMKEKLQNIGNLKALRDNQYNVVYRFSGYPSKQYIDCKVNYYEL